jgi:hypothetical protein
MKNLYLRFILLLTAVALLGTIGLAQERSEKNEFCDSNNYSSWGDNEYESSLREKTMSAGLVKVDSKNGRINVIGENRSDVLVRACVKAWAKTKEEAKARVDGIRIETSSTITATNTPEKDWSVSYEIRVPNSSDLDLLTRNGRIGIDSVQGQIKFETYNGRITLDKVSGDVKGVTRNGRVTVKLAGATFQGTGLDVKTNNGRISLYMPSNFAANVEAGTGNGRFSSDFSELQIPKVDGKKRKYGSNKVNASINGGGAKIRVVTGNGRVSINSSEE